MVCLCFWIDNIVPSKIAVKSFSHRFVFVWKISPLKVTNKPIRVAFRDFFRGEALLLLLKVDLVDIGFIALTCLRVVIRLISM